MRGARTAEHVAAIRSSSLERPGSARIVASAAPEAFAQSKPDAIHSREKFDDKITNGVNVYFVNMDIFVFYSDQFIFVDMVI